MCCRRPVLEAAMKNEEGHVALGSNKAKAMSIVSKPLVPRPRCLLQAIERLVEQTNMLGSSRVDEARGLLAVDHLIKIAMQESVLDVELMNRPSTGDGNAEDDMNRGRFDDRAESLVIVNAGLLREPANHPPCLVSSKTTIGAKLMLVDPFA
jgi:hypothetical protein